jgi:flagellar basal body-associated protein FliL
MAKGRKVAKELANALILILLGVACIGALVGGFWMISEETAQRKVQADDRCAHIAKLSGAKQHRIDEESFDCYL